MLSDEEVVVEEGSEEEEVATAAPTTPEELQVGFALGEVFSRESLGMVFSVECRCHPAAAYICLAISTLGPHT